MHVKIFNGVVNFSYVSWYKIFSTSIILVTQYMSFHKFYEFTFVFKIWCQIYTEQVTVLKVPFRLKPLKVICTPKTQLYILF